ncbi:MAG: hypothetical protein CM15mP83_1830 [Flavobacteriaceae bacterium]|nr:MAG: hypothetical protein CM15mP83_1830 [Flavobacteriaceae bacterium]
MGSTALVLFRPRFLSDGTLGFLVVLLFYTSLSWCNKIAAIAGEISKPEKNLPLTMIISLLLIMAVYVCVSMVLVNFIDGETLATDIRPFILLLPKSVGQLLDTLQELLE